MGAGDVCGVVKKKMKRLYKAGPKGRESKSRRGGWDGADEADGAPECGGEGCAAGGGEGYVGGEEAAPLPAGDGGVKGDQAVPEVDGAAVEEGAVPAAGAGGVAAVQVGLEVFGGGAAVPAGGVRGVCGASVREREQVRDPCEAGDDHAEGHPAGGVDRGARGVKGVGECWWESVGGRVLSE